MRPVNHGLIQPMRALDIGDYAKFRYALMQVHIHVHEICTRCVWQIMMSISHLWVRIDRFDDTVRV